MLWRDRYRSESPSRVHANPRGSEQLRAALLAMCDDSRCLVTAEGAEEPHSRHGGADETLSWTHAAGEQGPGAGGAAAQRRKVAARLMGFTRTHQNKALVNVLREKSSILASQRRMERKLKELNATLDQERIQHVEQRDQVPAAPPGFCGAAAFGIVQN